MAIAACGRTCPLAAERHREGAGNTEERRAPLDGLGDEGERVEAIHEASSVKRRPGSSMFSLFS